MTPQTCKHFSFIRHFPTRWQTPFMSFPVPVQCFSLHFVLLCCNYSYLLLFLIYAVSCNIFCSLPCLLLPLCSVTMSCNGPSVHPHAFDPMLSTNPLWLLSIFDLSSTFWASVTSFLLAATTVANSSTRSGLCQISIPSTLLRIFAFNF